MAHGGVLGGTKREDAKRFLWGLKDTFVTDRRRTRVVAAVRACVRPKRWCASAVCLEKEEECLLLLVLMVS